MKKLLPTLLLLLLASSFLQAESEKFVWKPLLMRLFIGGFDGSSYEIIYDGRDLRYFAAENMFLLQTTKPQIIKPGREQWQSFFNELNALRVWDWKGRYEEPNVKDGTVWSCIIVYETQDRRVVVSSGSNLFPKNYPDFLSTVKKLIGDRTFK